MTKSVKDKIKDTAKFVENSANKAGDKVKEEAHKISSKKNENK
ncbi:hypothetical protein [Acidianus infernus]|nr:hypothetical protein [Acidianus infernus]